MVQSLIISSVRVLDFTNNSILEQFKVCQKNWSQGSAILGLLWDCRKFEGSSLSPQIFLFFSLSFLLFLPAAGWRSPSTLLLDTASNFWFLVFLLSFPLSFGRLPAGGPKVPSYLIPPQISDFWLFLFFSFPFSFWPAPPLNSTILIVFSAVWPRCAWESSFPPQLFGHQKKDLRKKYLSRFTSQKSSHLSNYLGHVFFSGGGHLWTPLNYQTCGGKSLVKRSPPVLDIFLTMSLCAPPNDAEVEGFWGVQGTRQPKQQLFNRWKRWNTHLSYNDLESSNWNNRWKWMFPVPRSFSFWSGVGWDGDGMITSLAHAPSLGL